jgi:NTP pyrophosphatase (non-canonical NTP hydrolase)
MDFETNIRLFAHWANRTFVKATALSALSKLEEEIMEVRADINDNAPKEKVTEEYADCMMCIIHSAAKHGITMSELRIAFEEKFVVNAEADWIENENHTYNRIKKPLTINH